MKSKGTPGTDREGTYLVMQVVDYADSLLNVTNNYVTLNTQWLAEVRRHHQLYLCMAAMHYNIIMCRLWGSHCLRWLVGG